MIRLLGLFSVLLLVVTSVLQTLTCKPAISATVNPDKNRRWAIALHGGAGALPRSMSAEQQQLYREALTRALNRGKKILAGKGTALDATEAVVIELEDCYLFNAGRGAAFNRNGQHELDASIMDGATLRSGGVAIVKGLKNPIVAARVVMENTPHLLIAGDQAQQLAQQHGCSPVDQNYFYTKKRFLKLKKKLAAYNLPVPDQPGYELPQSEKTLNATTPLSGDSGTVGCVALDTYGRLAAATSTGGLTGKLPGRVGDSPICGAGNYANSQVAVGGTGKGEEFIRHSIAARVGWLIESGKFSVEQAVNHCLTNVLKRGEGGLIAVSRDGKLVLQSTTQTLPRGAADSSGRFEVNIWFNED